MPPPTEPPPLQLASATQADLARELEDADRQGTWTAVRKRWQGQVLRWTVTRQRLLCQRADACNVAAFPIRRPAAASGNAAKLQDDRRERGALVGWLPALKFAPGQFAALEARCGAAESCELTIEGTLTKLTASAEMPTSVELTDVRILPAQARG